MLALKEWRTDRSYLWSVFVGELVTAAIALADRPLCARLLNDLLPHAETCAVNAALVCFMGAHAHRVGLLYSALGNPQEAEQWLRRALEVHDLAALLSWPGEAVPALQLAGPAYPTEPHGQDPMLDRRALQAYRQRLADLEDELDSAQTLHDEARRQRATDEREQLLAELRRATRPGGTARPLGPSATERARKAVTARVRDAIRHIAEVHPDLGDYLDRTVRTGVTCRYDPPTG
ncbi:hypothetical protein OHA21_37640 [Actinoplanes sp. NBC_00393]|uniref:hypothetical protein n=1 Tax=Actinoplanes sp. NBC_00393 TaxID=2975953 RepID=UPI002E23C3B7